jgi:lipopolysaccharide transport system ATP-binding protein
MNVLSVSGIGKTYVRYRNEFQRVLSWFGVSVPLAQEAEILKDISFELRAGEAVGIIGANGAGKSTLLKIIFGTLKQSAGVVITRGRIAAILELGMGFSPELTGEQNVYRGAGLLGFAKAEIDAKLGEIEAFADIGAYFRQPMRTYSTGMQMRVAFAVATAWAPTILVVDEALAVGDVLFQQKCANQIKALKESGTALLFVSHDKEAILSICDSAILLQNGTIAAEGEPADVLDLYNASLAPQTTSDDHRGPIEAREIAIKNCSDDLSGIGHGSMAAKLIGYKLLDANSNSAEILTVGEWASFIAKIRVEEPLEKLVFGLGVRDRLGNMIFGTNTHHTQQTLSQVSGGSEFFIRTTFEVKLAPGDYSFHVALAGGETHLEGNYHWIDSIQPFTVVNHNKPLFVGYVWNEMRFEWMTADQVLRDIHEHN